MKSVLSTKAIFFSFAVAFFVAAFITFFVGASNGYSFTINAKGFYWNTLLVNATFMGDSFFAIGIAFFLLFFFNKKNLALRLMIAVTITLIIIQFVKNIFSGLPLQIFFEPGVVQNGDAAFFNENIISSHTSIAFTIAGFFALKIKNNFGKVVCFLLAFFVAYTRVILSGEVLTSILLGLIPSAMAIYFLYKLKNKKLRNANIYYYKTRRKAEINTPQILGM